MRDVEIENNMGGEWERERVGEEENEVFVIL